MPAARTSKSIVSRLAGTCPVCEARHKLTANSVRPGGRYGARSAEHSDGLKMVHHGYKRPGDGEGIVGDCFAVGRDPYEISCDATRDYLAIIGRSLAGCRNLLVQHLAGEIRTLEQRSWTRGELPVEVHAPVDWIPREDDRYDLPWDFNEVAAFALHAWIELHRDAVRSVRRAIDSHGQEVARLTKLITDWQLRPVLTIEELEAPKAAEKAARKQARVDARAAKLAQKIAFYQKRVDSGVKQRKPHLIADAFEHVQSSLCDFDVRHEDAVSALDRDHVFAAFGLNVRADARSGENDRIRSAMWETQMQWGKKMEWPAALR